MKKKFLAITVMVCVSAGLLCACGDTGVKSEAVSEEVSEEAADNTGVQEAASENSESENSADAEFKEALKDIGINEDDDISGNGVSEDNVSVDSEVSENMAGEGDFDYPSNAFEERVGKTAFESYDEIISLLQPEEAYAYVKIKGYDSEVLLVASGAYDNLDGNMAVIDAVPYTKKADGLYTADSMFYSGGTATPLAIDDEGLLYCATHHEVQKLCYGENGTDIPSIMVMESVYVDSFDDEGMPKTVGGFIRVDNTVIDNDGTEVTPDDVAMFDKMYEDYNNAHVINFTVVK